MTEHSAHDAADHAVALHYTGGDSELLAELVGLFLETVPERRAELGEAVARADARTVERVAHSLKGGLASLGAGPAAALAAELERLGAQARVDAWPEAVGRLEAELALAVAVFRRWAEAHERPA